MYGRDGECARPLDHLRPPGTPIVTGDALGQSRPLDDGHAVVATVRGPIRSQNTLVSVLSISSIRATSSRHFNLTLPTGEVLRLPSPTTDLGGLWGAEGGVELSK